MTEISGKEFGRLQSDVEHLRGAVDSHTAILLEIRDGMVTREEYDKRKEDIDVLLKDHSERIGNLEDAEKLRESSVWSKIAKTFQANVIKFIGGSLFIFALVMMFVVIQHQMDTSKEVPLRVKEIIKETEVKSE